MCRRRVYKINGKWRGAVGKEARTKDEKTEMREH